MKTTIILRHSQSMGKFGILLQSQTFCLKSAVDQEIEKCVRPTVDAIVVDGAPWVHMHPPRTSTRSGDSKLEVIAPIFEIPAKRIDVVFDVYKADSLKRGEREWRGQDSGHYIVRKDTHIPMSFSTTIMRNDTSKAQLFEMIASDIVQLETPNVTVVSTIQVDKMC